MNNKLYKESKEVLLDIMKHQKGYAVIRVNKSDILNRLIQEFPMIHIKLNSVMAYNDALVYICEAEYIGDTI